VRLLRRSRCKPTNFSLACSIRSRKNIFTFCHLAHSEILQIGPEIAEALGGLLHTHLASCSKVGLAAQRSFPFFFLSLLLYFFLVSATLCFLCYVNQFHASSPCCVDPPSLKHARCIRRNA